MMFWVWIFTALSIGCGIGFLISVGFARKENRGATILWVNEEGLWAARSHAEYPLWHDGAPVESEYVAHLAVFDSVIDDEMLEHLSRQQSHHKRRGDEP